MITYIALSGPSLRLTVTARDAVLQATDPGLCFEGSFGLQSDSQARLFGQCRPVGGGSSGAERAVLHVQEVTGLGPPGLQVKLLGADGRVLLGPQVLAQAERRAAAAPDRVEPTRGEVAATQAHTLADTPWSAIYPYWVWAL